MTIVKTYEIGGKRYQLVLAGERQDRQLRASNQRSIAHVHNGNGPGGLEELAEFWAILLTPEGVDHDAKDREAVKADVLTFPLGFFLQALRDLEEFHETSGATKERLH